MTAERAATAAAAAADAMEVDVATMTTDGDAMEADGATGTTENGDGGAAAPERTATVAARTTAAVAGGAAGAVTTAAAAAGAAAATAGDAMDVVIAATATDLRCGSSPSVPRGERRGGCSGREEEEDTERQETGWESRRARTDQTGI